MNSLSIAAFVALFAASSALIDCDDVLKSTSSFTGTCNNKWSNLKPLIKPTQSEVGYAWISHKLEDFGSSSDAQNEIDSAPTPAVIGPDNSYYIVDDHHTLCALDYSGYSSTSVTLDVICDKRFMGITMDEFWKEMQQKNLVYLGAHPKNSPNALPISIEPSQLPGMFSFTKESKSFTNDPWRAMASFSRKVKDAPAPAPSCSSSDSDYCERCMYRGCVDGTKSSGPGVAFFEFQWGYFLLDATFYQSSIWPSSSEWKAFYESYNSLPLSDNIDSIDTNDWEDSASLTIPLCRGSSTKAYTVPDEIFASNSTLPGYVEGYVKLEDDPDCDSMSCS